jgi:hypothetical protein
MRTETRRALRDFAWQNLLWWIFICFAQVVSAIPDIDQQGAKIPLLGVAGIFLFFIAGQHRAWIATILTMPFSRRDAGRALWWAAIGLPEIAFAVLNLLMAVAVASFGSKPLDAWRVVLWMLAPCAALALVTDALLPPVRDDGERTIEAYLSYTVLTLAMIGVIDGAPAAGPWLPVTVGLTALGIVVAILTYLRAERSVLRQLDEPDLLGTIRRIRRSSKASPTRPPGWNVVARRYGKTVLLTTLAVTTIIVFQTLFYRWHGERLHGYGPLIYLGAIFPIIVRPWLSAARVFGALPLSADRLAATLVAMAVAPLAIIASALFLACNAYDVCAPRTQPILPFLLWAPSLYPALWLRYVETRTAEVITILLLIAALGLLTILTAARPPTLLTLFLTGTVVAIGYLWTRHELRAGRHAYRRRKIGAFSIANAMSADRS